MREIPSLKSKMRLPKASAWHIVAFILGSASTPLIPISWIVGILIICIVAAVLWPRQQEIIKINGTGATMSITIEYQNGQAQFRRTEIKDLKLTRNIWKQCILKITLNNDLAWSVSFGNDAFEAERVASEISVIKI